MVTQYKLIAAAVIAAGFATSANAQTTRTSRAATVQSRIAGTLNRTVATTTNTRAAVADGHSATLLGNGNQGGTVDAYNAQVLGDLVAGSQNYTQSSGRTARTTATPMLGSIRAGGDRNDTTVTTTKTDAGQATDHSVVGIGDGNKVYAIDVSGGKVDGKIAVNSNNYQAPAVPQQTVNLTSSGLTR